MVSSNDTIKEIVSEAKKLKERIVNFFSRS